MLTLLNTTINAKYYRSFCDESSFFSQLIQRLQRRKSLSRVESWDKIFFKRYYNNISLDMISAIMSPWKLCVQARKFSLCFQATELNVSLSQKQLFSNSMLLKSYIFFSLEATSRFFLSHLTPENRMNTHAELRNYKTVITSYSWLLIY